MLRLELVPLVNCTETCLAWIGEWENDKSFRVLKNVERTIFQVEDFNTWKRLVHLPIVLEPGISRVDLVTGARWLVQSMRRFQRWRYQLLEVLVELFDHLAGELDGDCTQRDLFHALHQLKLSAPTVAR